MAENKKSFRVPNNAVYPKAADVTKDSFPIEGGVGVRGTDSTEFGVGNSVITTTYKGGLHSQSIVDANSTRPRISTRASQKLPDEPHYRTDYENYPDGVDTKYWSASDGWGGWFSDFNYNSDMAGRWIPLVYNETTPDQPEYMENPEIVNGGLKFVTVKPYGVYGREWMLGNGMAGSGISGYQPPMRIRIYFEQLGYVSSLGIGFRTQTPSDFNNTSAAVAKVWLVCDSDENYIRYSSDMYMHEVNDPAYPYGVNKIYKAAVPESGIAGVPDGDSVFQPDVNFAPQLNVDSNNIEEGKIESTGVITERPYCRLLYTNIPKSPTNPIGKGMLEYTYAWCNSDKSLFTIGGRFQIDDLSPGWIIPDWSPYPDTISPSPLFNEIPYDQTTIDSYFTDPRPDLRTYWPAITVICNGTHEDPNSWTIISKITVETLGDPGLGEFMSPVSMWRNPPVYVEHYGTGWGPEVFMGEESWALLTESNVTLASNVRYIVNTESSIYDLTFPLEPEFGDFIEILDYKNTFAINNCNIYFNGLPYNGDGSTPTIALDYPGTHVKFVYTDSTIGWKIVKD